MLRLLPLYLLTVLFGSTDGIFGRVCEHQTMFINCGSWAINIHRASYGRTQNGVCGNGGSTNCYAGGSWQVTRRECQGLQSCDLPASNLVFGDPCPGTRKYLEVTYQCVSKPPPEYLLRICEHNSHTIDCFFGKINIIHANYGRTLRAYVCPGPIRNWNCGASGSLKKVKDACQGKQHCHLSATNQQFGDPCAGTLKYLEVRYSCF